MWILAYCQTIPRPSPKEECSFSARQVDGEGIRRGGQGQNGDEIHGTNAVFVVGFGRKY